MKPALCIDVDQRRRRLYRLSVWLSGAGDAWLWHGTDGRYRTTKGKTMDINTAIATIRQADEIAPSYTEAQRSLLLGDVLEAFAAIDAWLSKGGYLPAAWHTARS